MAMPGDARIKFIFQVVPGVSNGSFPQFPGRFFRHFDEKKRVILFDTNQALAFLVTK